MTLSSVFFSSTTTNLFASDHWALSGLGDRPLSSVKSPAFPTNAAPDAMPKIKTNRTKAPPEGFDEIEPTLQEFDQRMKDGMAIFSTPKPSQIAKN